MTKESIFSYIKKHLDADGCFTSPTLPDASATEVVYLLGDEDGYYFTNGIPKEAGAADKLLQELRAYAAFPTEENLRQIESTLSGLIMIEILYDFSAKFTNDDYNNNMLLLARELFYNSSCRQAVKLAYLLLSCEGLTNIRQHKPDLWRDMLLVARCEEFTYYFILSARSELPQLQAELWEIIYHTKNWGRIFALDEAIITTKEQKLWCIANAMDTTAAYPPLSVKIILDCELSRELAAANISYAMFHGAACILLNFLEVLASYDLHKMENLFPVSQVDLPPLLHNFLRHAQSHADAPHKLLPIIYISEHLQQLIEEQNWSHLTANQAHSFLAACDRLIYQRSWKAEITSQLLQKDGSINHELCDFAQHLQLDIWQPVYDYLTQHPQDSELFSYLFSCGSPSQADALLLLIEQNIAYYSFYPLALLTPLAYLKDHPGRGGSLLLKLLQSGNEILIGMAYHVLRNWNLSELTLPLKQAIIKAQDDIASLAHRKLLASLLEDEPDNSNIM